MAVTGLVSAARKVTPDLPLIPRHTTEAKEREQIQYLIWRLDLFLKDAGASKERRKRLRNDVVSRFARGVPYGELCGVIESHMNGFLAKQAATIQSIYNEK